MSTRRRAQRIAGAPGVVALLLLWPLAAFGQGATVPEPKVAVEEENLWHPRASVTGYFYKEGAYFVPVAAVDHAGLHAEARYNYEAQKTGSVWIGWSVEAGHELQLTLTPIFGGVFGDLNGFAMGLEWSLSWKKLTLYSELELVVDLGPDQSNFFYVWTELDWQVLDWMRLGGAVQRTRAIASPRLVQWGPLIGFDIGKFSLTAYWFNPGQSDNQYWAVSFGAGL